MTITIPTWVLYSVAGTGALVIVLWIVFWAVVGLLLNRAFNGKRLHWS